MTTIVREEMVNASKEWIWSKLIDVKNWSKWDFEVKESQLYTSFNIGTKGYLLDLDNARSEFEITAIDQGESYSNVYFLSPDTLLNFKHTIIGASHPYLVRFEAFFSGNKANEYYQNYNKTIALTMEKALNNLAKLPHSVYIDPTSPLEAIVT